MRWLLLLAVLAAEPARGEELAVTPGMRDKLKARILETLPARSAPLPAEDSPEDEPILVLEPVVVTESRGLRELAKQLAADRERRKAESFKPLKGGTIYRSDRLELGGWWTPDSGWKFLKIKW